jgi:hypothetical protein
MAKAGLSAWSLSAGIPRAFGASPIFMSAVTVGSISPRSAFNSGLLEGAGMALGICAMAGTRAFVEFPWTGASWMLEREWDARKCMLASVAATATNVTSRARVSLR